MRTRILIIEDNLSNRELMTYLLTAFGHEVVQAETGLFGLEKAQSEHFDLILCDIQLPDIRGEEVALRLGATPCAERPPLIAVTALAMLGDRERILASGFDGYMSKPIEPSTFVDQVAQFVLKAKMGSKQPAYESEKANGAN